MLNNIPHELRTYRQWVLWRLEWKRDDVRHELKPTKIPYTVTGAHASVTDASTWNTFEAVCSAPVGFVGPCEWNTPISETGFSGIGFVFTADDEFCGIDLDEVHNDPEAYARQLKIYESFNSYSERSPSGKGLHIIVRATLAGRGRRRNSIELYDRERYFTMTGNVFRNVPIAERQEFTDLLYNEMGGPVQTVAYGDDQQEKQTDEEIIAIARNAANGHKFSDLYDGDWTAHYGAWRGDDGEGQSEADFALIDIIAYYTQNRAQIARIFHSSQLGKRAKNQRPAIIRYMVEKSFDRQVPPIDIEGLTIAFDKLLADRRGIGGNFPPEASTPDGKPSGKPSGGVNASPCRAIEADVPALSTSPVMSTFPPGLVGEIAQFIFEAAPRPVKEIALVGAIGFLAGICGRAYNYGNSGLNQYVLLIAETGRGKEAIAGGISKLMRAVQNSCPNIKKFEGPGEIASPQALLKWLAREPAIFSIVGEFGLKLKEMSAERAPPHITGLKRALLDLYHKSGRGSTLPAMAYSKREENTAVISSPSFTLIGESTPLRFYENIDENVVTDGLLPRFTIFHYEGDQVELNEFMDIATPSIDLVQKLAEIAAYSLSLAETSRTCDVGTTKDAKTILDAFEVYARHLINNRDPATGHRLPTRANSVVTELWNRAHIKACRLAALFAVGCNYHNPVIDAAQAQLATDEIFWQTKNLQARFDNGEVGGGAVNAPANEQKQTEVMVNLIRQLATKDFIGEAAYRINDIMQRDRVFPVNTLVQRLQIYPVFRNDRRGATEAIKKIYQQLLDNDDLREVSKKQMQDKYGKSCRAFTISDASRFLEAA